MLDVLNDLRRHKLDIEAEAAENTYRTASSIASKYGYSCLSLGKKEVLGVDDISLIFLGRSVPYNSGTAAHVIERFRSGGYEVNPVTSDGFQEFYSVVRSYPERGRVSVLGREEDKVPIFAFGQYGDQTAVGLVLDLGPEHVGIIEQTLDDMGMVPKREIIVATEMPSVFKKFVETLDL